MNTIELKLYRIDYESIEPIGGGIALVLAIDETEARLGWLSDPETPTDAMERLHSIKEVPDEEFYNRSVLINMNGDY